MKRLLADQTELSKCLSKEEIDSLKEQKLLLAREVELRKEAAERAQAEAKSEAQKKAKLQADLNALTVEMEEMKKKSKLCAIM